MLNIFTHIQTSCADLEVAQTNLIHLPSSTLCYLHVKHHHHMPPPRLHKGRKLRRRQRQHIRKRRKLFQCCVIVQQWVLKQDPSEAKPCLTYQEPKKASTSRPELLVHVVLFSFRGNSYFACSFVNQV